MDKKNTIIGVFLLAAALAVMVWQGKLHSIIGGQQEPEAQAISVEQADSSAQKSLFSPPPSPSKDKETTASLFAPVRPIEVQQAEADQEEELYTLENEFIAARFTTIGGAIKDVAFKKYPLSLDSPSPFVFNAFSDRPALAIGFEGENGKFNDYSPSFELVSITKDTILFSTTTPEGVQIFRGYSVATQEDKRDPYVILHETRFVNNSAETFNLKKLLISLGSCPPTKGDSFGEYLNVGYYNGKKAKFIKATKFTASKGFLGFGQHSAVESIEESERPIIWASVKNQFFASVLTPNEPGSGIIANPMNVGMAAGEEGLDEGITGSIKLELGQILPSAQRLVSLDYYVGPKEFPRLDSLGQNQDLVMQFGFFGIISKFLLLMMTAVNSFIPNWGLTIIIVTIIIKGLLWPLTAIQVRSSKRMAKIQEPLKSIKEKYKGNPQKIQTETLKLFKQNRVNPAAGCLPLVVQLPIFLGLYFMLRTSSELRFASFLWINDLSVPDTITYIMGYPLNILPLLMAVSMFFQMKMTPTPITDNAQKKIFQLMPFIFLVFCYNFPSGLVLYWTVQNLLTIFQQSITNRMKDPLENIPVELPSKSKGRTPTKNKAKSKPKK